MYTEQAATLLDALASGPRLEIFRLLVRTGPQGLVAGELAAQLGLPPTNLSFHAKTLTQAGLLSVEQEGRYQRYRASIPLMLDLIGYLTEECCAGHPEECAGMRKSSSCAPELLAPLPKAGKRAPC